VLRYCQKCNTRLNKITYDCFWCPKCKAYYVPSDGKTYSTFSDIIKQRTLPRRKGGDETDVFNKILKRKCGFEKGLNPAQKEALISSIRKIEQGARRGIIALPTGSGKTVLAACLLRWILTRLNLNKHRDIYAFFMAPSLVILEQVEAHDSDFRKIFSDLPVNIHALTEKRDRKGDKLLELLTPRVEIIDVHKVSYGFHREIDYVKIKPRPQIIHIIALTPQLIHDLCTQRGEEKREELFEKLDKVKVLIMDEVHHTYNGKEIQNTMREIINKIDYVIGLSATPTKEAKDNVGPIWNPGYSIEKAMLQKVLVQKIRFHIYNTNITDLKEPCEEPWKVAIERRAELYAERIIEKVEEEAKRAGEDRILKTAIACPNVREADILFDILDEKIGDRTEIFRIHYQRNERDVLRRFRECKSGVLVSVNMINIGFNDRDLEVLVLARPIRNPISYVQLVGRVLRIPSGEWNIKSENKLGYAIVMDLTNSLCKIARREHSDPSVFFSLARRVISGSEEARGFEEDLKGDTRRNSRDIKKIEADVRVTHYVSRVVSPIEAPRLLIDCSSRKRLRKSLRKAKDILLREHAAEFVVLDSRRDYVLAELYRMLRMPLSHEELGEITIPSLSEIEQGVERILELENEYVDLGYYRLEKQEKYICVRRFDGIEQSIRITKNVREKLYNVLMRLIITPEMGCKLLIIKVSIR